MNQAYVHALRFRWLNRFYDPSVRFLTREKHFRRLLLEQIHLEAGESVLDLGCGSGTLALMISSAHPAAEIHGLDGDADMLGRARRKAGMAKARIQLHHADARQMPFPDHCFDLVVSSLFFHHLDHAGRAGVLEETARVLRPCGRLLIIDWGPAAGALQWLLSWPVRWFDGPAITRDNFRGRLPAMIRDAGFKDLQELSLVKTSIGTLRTLGAKSPNELSPVAST